MATPITPKVQVVLRKPRPVTAIIALAQAIEAAMSAHTTTFPSPSVSMAQFTSDISALVVAQSATAARTIGRRTDPRRQACGGRLRPGPPPQLRRGNRASRSGERVPHCPRSAQAHGCAQAAHDLRAEERRQRQGRRRSPGTIVVAARRDEAEAVARVAVLHRRRQDRRWRRRPRRRRRRPSPDSPPAQWTVPRSATGHLPDRSDQLDRPRVGGRRLTRPFWPGTDAPCPVGRRRRKASTKLRRAGGSNWRMRLPRCSRVVTRLRRRVDRSSSSAPRRSLRQAWAGYSARSVRRRANVPRRGWRSSRACSSSGASPSHGLGEGASQREALVSRRGLSRSSSGHAGIGGRRAPHPRPRIRRDGAGLA